MKNKKRKKSMLLTGRGGVLEWVKSVFWQGRSQGIVAGGFGVSKWGENSYETVWGFRKSKGTGRGFKKEARF